MDLDSFIGSVLGYDEAYERTYLILEDDQEEVLYQLIQEVIK